MNLRIRWQHRLTGLLLVMALFALAPVLRGQDAGPPQPAAAAPVKTDDNAGEAKGDAGDGASDSDGEQAAKDNSILAMIVDSGFTGMLFMGILGLFSIVAGTVAVERFVNMRRNRLLPADLLDDLEAATQRRLELQRLSESCRNHPGPLATILESALLRAGRPLGEVEKSMEDAAVREMSELRAKIRPLNTVGSIAPLVGLLGTVVGMIIAFHTASQAGLGKAELLAKGIYMALLTTAGGLSVAIPSLLLSGFFNGRLDRFFREIDRRLMHVLPSLAGGAVSQTSGPPSSTVELTAKAEPTLQTSANPIEHQAKKTSPIERAPKAEAPAASTPTKSKDNQVEAQGPTTRTDAPQQPTPAPPSRPANRRTKNNPLMGDKVKPK